MIDWTAFALGCVAAAIPYWIGYAMGRRAGREGRR